MGDIKLGRGSALPAWLATIGATASWIMWKIGAGGFWVFRNISSYCGSKIDSCAGIIIGIIKGQQWAFDKARNWANGRN